MAKPTNRRPQRAYTRFDALSVRTYEKDGEEANAWLRCGVAFMNDDGSGGKIQLQTVPASGPDGQVIVILRPPLADKDEAPHRAKGKARDKQEEDGDDLPF